MTLPDFLSDVSISNAAVPLHIKGITSRGVLWEAAPGCLLLNVPGVARYMIKDKKSITIEPQPSASKAEVLRFLRMTPLAALLFQRGILAFHAAAVADTRGAILIAGDSGTGKSALAAAMLKRGWNYLADDLAAVDLNTNGVPTVFPTYPGMILWSDALQKLGLDWQNKGRHILDMTAQFVSCPQPLRAIYRLSIHKEEIELSGIAGAKLFSTLTTLLYNSRVADALLDRAAFMQMAAAVAQNVSVQSLRRPQGRWCVDELADIIEGKYR
jgi:hypothetical protein